MASKKEESVDTSNTCVVCFKGVDIYSIGQCDHPVCFECSTRMRVLCRQNECPICRQEMPKVIFTKNVRPFNNIQSDNYLTDFKFKINFETEDEARAFEILLAHECPKCNKVFSSFTQLRDHVRRTHNLNYCDLCVENLKILSRERRCYTRQELATHRRVGDVDDRSHRGHPLCEFCDTRYMDNDELYRHLRRDHLFCHFCDADGLHQYYSSYDFLREHFRNEHYLCEEGDCYNEKFTAVFRTDIDLKAHKTTAHGKGLGKAGLKQARTLDIEFTLAPRPRPIPRSRQYNREEENDVGAVGGSIQEETSSGQDKNHVFAAQINTGCIEEFPSLGGSSLPTTVNSTAASSSGRNTASSVIRRGCARLYEDDFPALGPDTTQVSLKVNSERPLAVHNQSAASSQTRSSSTNVSIQVNHPRFTTTVTSHNTYNYHFPALDTGVTVGPTATSTSVHWTSKRSSENKSLATSHSSQQHHQPNVTTTASSGHDPPPGLEAFPALTYSTKNKSSQLDNQTMSLSNDTSCEPPSVAANSKNKKKKSKSKNINTNVSNEQSSINKDTNNSAKKKQNNFESKTSDDSLATNSKKKAKENSNNNNEIGSSLNANTVNNNNNSNNRKVLKSAKVENLKANQTNNSQKKKEDSGSKTIANKEKTTGSTVIEKKKEARGKRSSETSRTAVGGGGLPLELGEEPFPALGNATTVPPGFEPKWQIKRAPPGLEKCSSGGGITSTTPVAPPGFNHLNGFPPLAAELDATNKANYITPPDFAKRNNMLVTKMTSALGPEALELFKQISFSFRSGNLPANEYYSNCRKIMGPNTFTQLFPELLALLPDIDKQQELWSVYKSEFGKEELSGGGSSSAPVKTKKGATINNSSALEVCATCYQVVSTSDLRDHLTFHALDNHFPVLDSSHNNTYNNNAWIQHK